MFVGKARRAWNELATLGAGGAVTRLRNKKQRTFFYRLLDVGGVEGVTLDRLKIAVAFARINAEAMVKRYMKRGWVERNGDLYHVGARFYADTGEMPLIHEDEARMLGGAAYKVVSRGVHPLFGTGPLREVFLLDAGRRELARVHVRDGESLPGEWVSPDFAWGPW